MSNRCLWCMFEIFGGLWRSLQCTAYCSLLRLLQSLSYVTPAQHTCIWGSWFFLSGKSCSRFCYGNIHFLNLVSCWKTRQFSCGVCLNLIIYTFASCKGAFVCWRSIRLQMSIRICYVIILLLWLLFVAKVEDGSTCAFTCSFICLIVVEDNPIFILIRKKTYFFWV